ncbi:MAG: hypothetical protein ACR2LF_13025 [Jatrophihabitantaceae bacterium]
MTTADRIDVLSWAPPASSGTVAGDYAGRHRRPETRHFSFRRMFYLARHLARGR